MNQIKHLRELRVAKADEMTKIMKDCETEKRTRTEGEKLKWQSLEKEVRTMDEEIKDLEKQELIDMSTARPVGEARVQIEETERRYLDKAKTISIIDSKTKLARKEDRSEIGLGQLILAKLRGPQNEAEERTLSTSLDASGGISTVVSRQFWDRTRSASRVIQAGASVLDYEAGEHGNVVIPQITGSIVPEWKVENVAVTLSDPTFTPRVLDFKTIMSGTLVSNELIQDGGTLLASMIEHDLSQGFGSAIDDAALFGAGSATEPRGIINTVGINEFDLNGELTDWDPLTVGVEQLLQANVPLENISAFIMSAREWGTLARLKTATELMQLDPPSQIANIPKLVTTKIEPDGGATAIFVADWSKLVIGFRLRLKIKFHEQTYAQNFATLITGVARLDVALVHPSSFSVISGIAETSIT